MSLRSYQRAFSSRSLVATRYTCSITLRFLTQLQKRIAENTHNCMRIEHDTYRNFYTEKRTDRWQGFVDGDLVETLADFPRERANMIVTGIRLPKELAGESE